MEQFTFFINLTYIKDRINDMLFIVITPFQNQHEIVFYNNDRCHFFFTLYTYVYA